MVSYMLSQFAQNACTHATADGLRTGGDREP
eukprot:COSAG02_NODE_590_length_19879_cov_4.877755_6_plen_31_part_00